MRTEDHGSRRLPSGWWILPGLVVSVSAWLMLLVALAEMVLKGQG